MNQQKIKIIILYEAQVYNKKGEQVASIPSRNFLKALNDYERLKNFYEEGEKVYLLEKTSKILTDIGFLKHKPGDKFLVLRMMGQNFRVKNLKNNAEELLSLDDFLKTEDYEIYKNANKYNI